MRQEHGWRLTDIGWTPELLFPQRTGALKGAALLDTWGSGLSIIALKETDSGLKQWALYHYIASLGDGTADTDGWLTMTVHGSWWWFQTHCSESRAHLKRVSPCPYSGGWSLKRLFLYGSGALPWFLVSWTSCQCLYNHLPHQVKRERHYKVYTRTSA